MAKSKESLNKKLLTLAITATKAREIKDIIDQGADVNAHNEWGLTPVMLAAQYNHSVVVLNALIQAGADIHEAEPKYRSNSLHLAANSSKNPKVIEALLAAGANIDARNYLGETALIMAVNSNPETKITTQLIKSGADVNACDYQGHSVLDYAKNAKRTYVINLLKENGAN
ncbi:MAG TPA: ankyrin repeat domain-containing protein [Candidatus Ornithospirochaeta avicola]|uniref:Ankyrin repeat domain-containing protein n=1 Tax=Candidatus Ornithospirochaeta avicola TaxID=2840896 RepID=A0A9D1TMT1_9SPIO|nr:ankyrin repeat domain-containing protein [Candidatus Ornithospirochaeta avicola]